MKVAVKLWSPKEDSARNVPPELRVHRTNFIRQIVYMMGVFAIEKISLTHKLIGIKTITNASFKPISGVDPNDVPESIKQSRVLVLRWLNELMALFGILEVELQLGEKDIQNVKKCWTDKPEECTENGGAEQKEFVEAVRP